MFKRQIYLGVLGLFFGMSLLLATTAAHVPGELILTLESPGNGGSLAMLQDGLDDLHAQFASDIHPVFAQAGVGQLQSINTQPKYLKLNLKNASEMDAAIQAYEALGAVKKAEPNYYVYASSTPNDPLFNSQPYFRENAFYQVTSWAAEDPVIVAVLDTGIDYLHEDLLASMYVNENDPINGIDDDGNGRIDDYYGANFYRHVIQDEHTNVDDDMGHGTHIAGIIAAKSNNGIGIAGVNDNVKVLNVRFLNEQGAGGQFDAAAAIRYAVAMGAKVINCSWGYQQGASYLEDAINEAIAAGVVVVAATGNDGDTQIDYPAAYDGVIGVGSVDADFDPSGFSNSGSQLDFAAGGQHVYSTIPGGYGIQSGTSQSTAFVSGLAAHIVSLNSDASLSDIMDLMIDATQDLASSGWDSETGYGYIQPNTLSELILVQTESNDASSPALSSGAGNGQALSLSEVLNFPNPVRSNSTTFGFTASKQGTAKISIYDLSGRKLNELTQSVLSGYNTIAWTPSDLAGRSLPNGTYIYTVNLAADGDEVRHKSLLSILK